MIDFDPLSNEYALRAYLLKLKESEELEILIEKYISVVLKNRLISYPSKGPYGEKGKDLVALENGETNDYCSYIIKRGELSKNLDGKYGILRQMNQAMLMDHEIYCCKGRKRTAVIVHNGKEGYRGATQRFEDSREMLENQIGSLLLRPIERWDIDVLAKKIFEERETFKKIGTIDHYYEKLERSYDFFLDIRKLKERHGAENYFESIDHKTMLKDIFKRVKEHEFYAGPFTDKIDRNENGK